ncbi:MAG: DUF2461 domain-containing protein [Bacteroidia bacterium]
MSVTIKKETIDFLKMLSKNNNREWFAKHKDKYVAARENMVDFADALLTEMNKHDNIETESGKKSLYRIYRDVRFSKDKTPYSEYWGGGYRRATKKLRGGYYFHIEKGNSSVIGGFWGPNSDDLARIRQDIDLNSDEWRKVLNSKSFKQFFGNMRGEQVKSAPRGFDKNHEAIDLLRYKQFLIKHSFTDVEVLSKDFVKKVNEAFKKMRPFFDHMSEILTTDSNGELIV